MKYMNKSIEELHNLLKTGEVTSEELIKESLALSHEIQEKYNAFVTILDEAKPTKITDNLLSGINFCIFLSPPICYLLPLSLCCCFCAQKKTQTKRPCLCTPNILLQAVQKQPVRTASHCAKTSNGQQNAHRTLPAAGLTSRQRPDRRIKTVHKISSA